MAALADTVTTDVVVWDDPAVEWSRFDTVVIRSTWDYHRDRDEFLDWARRVDAVAPVWNPPDVLAWNTDKRYLADLVAAGVPVVPTTFVAPGRPIGDGDLVGDVVVKPSVGAGSHGVIRSGGDVDRARRHVAGLHAAGRTAMIQPYQVQVDTLGETGLVYLGGEYSHAFGKSAILAGPTRFDGGLFADEDVEPRVATAAERELGDLVVASIPPVAYARVDLLPSADGPLLLELELTEPSLFLECHPSAAQRAAAAFRSLMA